MAEAAFEELKRVTARNVVLSVESIPGILLAEFKYTKEINGGPYTYGYVTYYCAAREGVHMSNARPGISMYFTTDATPASMQRQATAIYAYVYTTVLQNGLGTYHEIPVLQNGLGTYHEMPVFRA